MRLSLTAAAVAAILLAGGLASVLIRTAGAPSPETPFDPTPAAADLALSQHEVFCPWASLPTSARTDLFGEADAAATDPVCRFDVTLAGEGMRTIDLGGGETATLQVQPAAPLQFPRLVDSNSPAFWADGELVLFNSFARPARISGSGLEHLNATVEVELAGREREGGFWLESVWRDESDGTVYGWYHLEPPDLDCLTAPLIGAAVSHDNGATWLDSGAVLESGQSIDCSYDNGYFVGGHGDFSVVLDPLREYFYFLFTDYGSDLEEQGVSLARSAFADRGQPGTVFKYYAGAWDEPGVGGRSDALIPANTGWQTSDVEEFWGPSVHWNTRIERYVALLNRTQGYGWEQEGIYIAFSPDLLTWSEPEMILRSSAWYPQVIGLGPGETDSLAGATARLFVGGVSTYTLTFEKN